MNRATRTLLDAHTIPIVRAIKAIVSERVFVSLAPRSNDPNVLVVSIRTPQSRPVRLASGERSIRLWFRAEVNLLVTPRPSSPADGMVSPDRYTFQLFRGDGRTQFDEIAAYHWTPNDPAAKRSWPHLHIGSAFIDPPARREP